CQHYYNTPLTC
nr:immunoglobulin light chain junction region [Macaca mulatta]